MKEIKLKIYPDSPLAIGRKKPGGSVSEAQDYIPGSVIRGAMADALMQLAGNPTEGDDFSAIFLGEAAAIFCHAYPAPYILPATAVSSKTDSGFKPDKHGVFDTLIDRFCAEAYNYPYDPSCPEDGGRVEPYSGYYDYGEGKGYQSYSSSKRLLTRSSINRRRATTEEEMLYSLEVLNEKSKNKDTQKYEAVIYQSSILLKDEALANGLGKFINDYRHSIRLGGAKSRGLGKVRIEAEVLEPNLDVQKQIDQFNQQLKNRWKLWSVFGEPQEDLLSYGTYFTLNLQSDAILRENWLPTTVISEKMLQELAGLTDPSLRLHTAYSSYDYLSGWNTAWGLMKDIELITNKGSVYLFSTGMVGSWLPKLEQLCLNGIGERRLEGFGQIKICDRFHSVFRESAV